MLCVPTSSLPPLSLNRAALHRSIPGDPHTAPPMSTCSPPHTTTLPSHLPPLPAAEAFSAAGGAGARKRSYHNGDAGAGAAGGPSIVEGEEEEGEGGGGDSGAETVGEGPTPQRPRRAGGCLCV